MPFGCHVERVLFPEFRSCLRMVYDYLGLHVERILDDRDSLSLLYRVHLIEDGLLLERDVVIVD